MKKQKIIIERRTQNGVVLNPNTAFFGLNEKDKAITHVYYQRTYIGRCLNQFGDLIGWYCPA